MRDDNGESVDDIMPLILEVAHKYLIKVCVMFSNNIQTGFILMSFFVYRLQFTLNPTKKEMKSTCSQMSNT